MVFYVATYLIDSDLGRVPESMSDLLIENVKRPSISVEFGS